ncbi:MAG: hypothetical protein K1X35_09750 [Caulobacteraceae bacterium]|nr:hypothetical protein [Caulobacteraceae bacterium]
MRARLSLAAGLIASLALLGACQKEPDAEAYAEAAPPPAETTQVAPLAGAPAPDTRQAANQAADDAYMARLEAKGLMAERRIDPATGKTVLVVFNRPIQNPVLRGGPHYRYAANNHRARRGAMGGSWASNSAGHPVASAAAGSAATAASGAASSAPATTAAPAADTAAPVTVASTPTTGPGVRPIPQAAEPAVNVTDPARAGFPPMTPMMWGIVGLIVLALLIALFVANRPRQRRPAYSGHQAPPEASGGDHGQAHA